MRASCVSCPKQFVLLDACDVLLNVFVYHHLIVYTCTVIVIWQLFFFRWWKHMLKCRNR